MGVDLSRVEFFRFPTNRGWTRDFGPIFVKRDGNHPLPPPYQGGERASQPDVAIVDFGFNGWAKYPNWQKDNKVASLAAAALGCRLFVAQALLPVFVGTVHQPRAQARVPVPLVLEGGSIDGNGRGTLLTTEECLLDPEVQVRNPGLTRQETEEALREYLGVKNVLWLGKGIAGDDTHGHVDDLCRFVGPRTVVLCQESDSSEANYRALQENRERLQGMRLEDGSRIEVVALPMPMPLFFDGQRLPASYANFYISNAAVLVPTFNDPNDRDRPGHARRAFPRPSGDRHTRRGPRLGSRNHSTVSRMNSQRRQKQKLENRKQKLVVSSSTPSFYGSRRCLICSTNFPMSTGRKRIVSKPRPSRPPFTLKVWLAMIQMGMRFAQIVKRSTSAVGLSLADMSAMRSAGRGKDHSSCARASSTVS